MTLTPRLALLLTLPPALWAGNAVVGRLMVGQVPPLTLNWLRWAIAFLLLLPLGWRVLRPLGPGSPIAQRWGYLLLLGFLGVGSFNCLQYSAVATSTPLNVTLVGCSMPVWILAVGALFYGVKPTQRQLWGAAIGLAGVLTVITRGEPQALLKIQFVVGDLLMLVAVIGWAFYSWLLSKPPAHMVGSQRPTAEQGWDWAGLLLVQMVFGLMVTSVFAGTEQALGAAPIQWSTGVLLALAYIAIGPSLLAYRCWGLGVAEGGPALAAFFNNLTPVFAALLSGWVLGQWPQGYHALAFVLVVAGIVVSTGKPVTLPAAPTKAP
jgi:drug/metabolite transporter (DMT)-like permease